MQFRAALPAIILLCLCLTCAASDYYVDVNNPLASDSNPGTQALPWKTINQAMNALIAGDTAYVLPGTYDISAGPFVQAIAIPEGGTAPLKPPSLGSEGEQA